jgi:adenosine deaminase
MTKKEFYSFLRKIPKSEIHLHAEAVISLKLVSKMISRQNPVYRSLKEVDALFSYDNLKEFIKVFLLIQNSFETRSDFDQLFNNIALYLKKNGIVYSEMFFSPSLFVKNGWKFDDLMEIIIKNINKIYEKNKITIKMIIDISRTFGAENAKNNLLSLLKFKKNTEIIGIGLGGDEKKGPAIQFAEVFKMAKENNLHRVVHAGEDVGPESVWDAIKYLDAERIGHGISSIVDKKLMKYLADKQIPLEICPTSNIFTKKFVKKMEDHPIRTFFENGLFVTCNTDDPTFFKVSLIDEYWNLYSKLGFSLEDIKTLIINGFNASFMTKSQKKEYIKEIADAWEKYFPY